MKQESFNSTSDFKEQRVSKKAMMDPKNLLQIIQTRRSVRVYKTGKVSDEQLQLILEAARWAPSGANTQPWELVVTRDRKKMKRIRQIYDNEWRQRKREDPINYKGLKKDYVGDVSVIVLVCGDRQDQTSLSDDTAAGRPRETLSSQHRQRRAADDACRGKYEFGNGLGFSAGGS